MKNILASVVLALCLVTGCINRPHHSAPTEPRAYQPAHKVISPAHPIEGVKTEENKMSGELSVARTGAIGAVGLSIIATCVLLALRLTLFATIAAAVAAGATLFYSWAVTAAVILPWMPFVVIIAALVALVGILILALRHHGRLTKAIVAKLEPSAVQALTAVEQKYVNKFKAKI